MFIDVLCGTITNIYVNNLTKLEGRASRRSYEKMRVDEERLKNMKSDFTTKLRTIRT